MVYLHIAVIIANNDLSQEMLTVDMLTAIKSSLDHCRKHVSMFDIVTTMSEVSWFICKRIHLCNLIKVSVF